MRNNIRKIIIMKLKAIIILVNSVDILITV